MLLSNNKNMSRMVYWETNKGYLKRPFKPYEFPWGMMVYETPIYNMDYIGVLDLLLELI
jgi:hypothetical protein